MAPIGNGMAGDFEGQNQKPSIRHWYTSKWFFAIVLIVIIIGSTVGLALPSRVTLKRLRTDIVPQGAYVVPWMKPYPSPWFLLGEDPTARFWNIDTIMNGSVRFDFTFKIPVPNGTRIVPATAYLGHDGDFLYFGIILRGMYGNPTTNYRNGYPNEFDLLFDPEDSGLLSSPETGSSFSIFILCDWPARTCPSGWSSTNGAGTEDLAWTSNLPQSDHSGWISPSFLNCNQPQTTSGPATEYQASTGTLQLLFARLLREPGACANSLQMNTGERWVIKFLIVLGYPNNGEYVFYDPSYVDAWPVKPNPLYSSNTSGWAQMSIDLSTPPD